MFAVAVFVTEERMHCSYAFCCVSLGTKINLLDYEVKRSKVKSQGDHIQSNKHFGRHSLTSLRKARKYFNETYHSSVKQHKVYMKMMTISSL